MGEGGMGLSPMQQRLAEAELEHKLQLRTGTKPEFVEALQSVWYDKISVSKITRFLQRHATGPIPRSKDDNIAMLFDLIKRTA